MTISTNLFKKIQGLNNKGLTIMENRETGDVSEIIDEPIVVDNYEFGKSKDGEYVAFTIQGNDTEFFFGGSVVTESFHKLENLLSEEEKLELMTSGVPILLEKIKSENKRTYTKCTFFPNN